MKSEVMEQLLLESGALLEGHFLLTSGKHSNRYIEKSRLLELPWATEEVGKGMADAFKDDQIEVVVGPMTGGILLAHETGKALKTRAIFTEREQGKMIFRRGFELKPGERVLIVEDIVTTGGSVFEVMEAVKKHGGNVVGVALMVNRSGGKVDFGVKTHSLLELDVPAYQPEECPLCKDHVPMTERGSRHLK